DGERRVDWFVRRHPLADEYFVSFRCGTFCDAYGNTSQHFCRNPNRHGRPNRLNCTDNSCPLGRQLWL
ncbi:MAG: hypothetical protein ACHQ50_16000, partial [Fimbriimonadales bacterium]